jgi:sensitive to high expression protein 9
VLSPDSGKEDPPPQDQQSSQERQNRELPFGNASPSLDLNSLRALMKARASALSSQAAISLSELGGRLNKITGYEHIEILKHQVVENGKYSNIY